MNLCTGAKKFGFCAWYPFSINEEISAPQTRDAKTENSDAKNETEFEKNQLNNTDAIATRDKVRDAKNETDQGNEVEKQGDAEPRTRDADDAVRDAEGAGDPFVDLSKYTLTTGEAIDRFAELGRVAPANRTMQEHCKDSRIDCYKLKTTRDGKYVSEWLVNQESLDTFIKARPQVRDAENIVRGAEEEAPKEPVIASDAAATRTDVPVAQENQAPQGETRSLARVLIDNARITAENEGKDELIMEMRKDKKFLQEEVVDARELRRDLKTFAERALITNERIALGGIIENLPPASSKRDQNEETRVIKKDVGTVNEDE